MYEYGMRLDDDSNAITQIDEENLTARSFGYVDGEPVEFSSVDDAKFKLRVRTVTVSDIAVPAQGGKQGQVAVSQQVDGCKLIGIIGWACSAWEVSPSKLETILNGGLVWYSLANASTSAKTVSLKVTLLYISADWDMN